MSSYDDGRDDALYREGGGAQSEAATSVRHPSQEYAQSQSQFRPGGYGQPGYGQPGYGQPGYGQPGPGYPVQGQQFHAPVYGYGQWTRPRRQYPIETKPFFLTSEFVGSMLAILGIAITAASSEAFGAWRAWILITAIVVGYMISRGIAKSGTRSHSSDPREQLDLNWGRSDSGQDA
jgi:hypothetical protein